jgi:tRNA(fMet)-specific endonuclease VapC
LLDDGKPKGFADLSIAATALIYDLTLVTHNTADYVDIPDLRIEDWLVK